MKVDIWMPIYIGDYLRDTSDLTAEEHGAYLLLLMHYWQKDGKIGCDISRLARVAKTSEETCSFLLGSYFTLENGNYKNKRADEEIEKAKSRRLASSINGQKGGRPRKNNLEKTYGYSVGNLDETYRKPNAKPRSNLEKSSSPSSSPSYKNKDNIIEATQAPPPSQKKELAKVKSETDPLYQAIFQSFIGKVGAFTNYPKEAQAIKRIIKYCEQHAPNYTNGDLIKLAELVITKYYELTQGSDRFWSAQPFTPSNLSAPGIFDRVLVEIRRSTSNLDSILDELEAKYAKEAR